MDKPEAVRLLKETSNRAIEKSKYCDNLGMQAMYLSDAADFLRIADLLESENEKTHRDCRAASFASRLDSAARDDIPRDVWNFLFPNLGKSSPRD